MPVEGGLRSQPRTLVDVVLAVEALKLLTKWGKVLDLECYVY